jgi:hypothetical protein
MALFNIDNIPIYVIIILIVTVIILVLSSIVLYKVDLIQNMKEKFTDSDKWSLIDWIFVILSFGIWRPNKKIFIPPPISTIKSFKAPSPRSLSEGNFSPVPPGFIASMGDPRDINLTTIPTAQNHAGIFLPNTGSSLSATPSPSPLRPQTTFSAINTNMGNNLQTNQMYLPAPAPSPTSQSIFSSVNTKSSMGSSVTQTSSPSPYSFVSSPGPASVTTVFNTPVNQVSNLGNFNSSYEAELKNEESYGINPDGDSVTQTSSSSPLPYSFVSSPGPASRSSPGPASRSSPGPASRSSPGPVSTYSSIMSSYNKRAATYNDNSTWSQSKEFSN